MNPSVPPASDAAPQRESMTGAQFIARTLESYGIDHVFFVESSMRRTLNELEILGVKRIGARSEKGAAYMADGYARTRKGPGICIAQSVGAANMAAGLQDAFLGQSPVIAITGRKTPIFQYRNAYQEIDHMPMFSAVTKYSVTVDDTEQLPFLLRQAIRESTSGAPGPAHLDIAGGWGGQLVEDGTAELAVVDERAFAHYPSVRPLPPDQPLLDAVALLVAAERPVIVAAGGAVMSGAAAEVRELAERLQIPVATSLNGKNSIPENHPLSIGVVGSYSRKSTNELVGVEADLVFYIGSRTGDQVTLDWTVPGYQVPVIQLDIEPTELGRSYHNAVSIAGDARESLRRMLALITDDQVATAASTHAAWTERAREHTAAWWETHRARTESTSAPVTVERLCTAIAEALPEDAILVSDTGSAGIWTGAYIPLTHPGQLYLRAAGSLGWGFPAALGAKCAAPDRPVVCFTGDGGFWYHLNEMETAVRWGINTVTIVNNNHGYGQCISAVEESYIGYTGNPEEIYGITETDFAALAEQIGCLGIRVTDPAELPDALARALAADRPVVIDVVTDTDSRAPSGWKPTA
ncbi:MAG: thiamine pyrophosphate-binding protein [Microbacteriaceae bacterium]